MFCGAGQHTSFQSHLQRRCRTVAGHAGPLMDCAELPPSWSEIDRWENLSDLRATNRLGQATDRRTRGPASRGPGHKIPQPAFRTHRAGDRGGPARSAHRPARIANRSALTGSRPRDGGDGSRFPFPSSAGTRRCGLQPSRRKRGWQRSRTGPDAYPAKCADHEPVTAAPERTGICGQGGQCGRQRRCRRSRGRLWRRHPRALSHLYPGAGR